MTFDEEHDTKRTEVNAPAVEARVEVIQVPRIFAALGDKLLRTAAAPDVRPVYYSEEGADEKNVIGFFIPSGLDGYQAMCDILQACDDAKNARRAADEEAS